MMIPNNVHFIWLNGPMARPFSLINMIAIKAAKSILSPDAIYVHCDSEPKNNKYWDAIRDLIIIRPAVAPVEWQGIPLEYVQYRSDVLRLQILHSEGGIYLDTDMIMVKPISDLMNNSCVMGIENSNLDGTPQSLTGAIIMAAPNSEFIMEWMGALKDGLRTGIWAHHCVVTPAQLACSTKAPITIMPQEVFVPFDLHRNHAFLETRVELPNETRAIHIWETYWRQYLDLIDEDFVRHSESLFARLAEPYLTAS